MNWVQQEFIFLGEHIDYCGYSVLPMAIDQDIVSIFATTDETNIEIKNTDPSYSYETNNLSIFHRNQFCLIDLLRSMSMILQFHMKNHDGLNISNVEFKEFVINSTIFDWKVLE